MITTIKNLFYLGLILLFLTQCGLYKKTDARKVPVNANDRVQKNLEEGRRIKFGNIGNSGSGNFEFATSNEMWRATIDILDFMPFDNADYGGGVIITDWYNTSTSNDAIKIMVRFLSNEIRADGLKISVYKKICPNENAINCKTQIDNTNKIGQELKLAILKKAAELKLETNQKNVEEYRKNNPGPANSSGPKIMDLGKGDKK
jgi:hypothetical protein